MVHVVFYEKPGCVNNTRQKRALRLSGHEVEARDILAHPWTPETLLPFFDHLPIPSWFNRSAPRVKSGEIRPDELDEQTALFLMCRDPLLIRRPLMTVEKDHRCGFDEAAVSAWIGLAPAPAIGEECPRQTNAHPCPPVTLHPLTLAGRR